MNIMFDDINKLLDKQGFSQNLNKAGSFGFLHILSIENLLYPSMICWLNDSYIINYGFGLKIVTKKRKAAKPLVVTF